MNNRFFSLVFLLLFVPLSSFADNFNYGSSAACKNAFENYYDQASNLSFEKSKQGDEDASEGFLKMGGFFNGFAHYNGSSTENCRNGKCIYTIVESCSLANPGFEKLWKLGIPHLQQITALLKQEKYDIQLAKLQTIQCSYPQGHANYNNCKISSAA